MSPTFLIFLNSEYEPCLGTLIHKQWALTAAHCFLPWVMGVLEGEVFPFNHWDCSGVTEDQPWRDFRGLSNLRSGWMEAGNISWWLWVRFLSGTCSQREWGSWGTGDKPVGNKGLRTMWYKSKNYGTAMEVVHFPDKETEVLMLWNLCKITKQV